MPKYQVVRKKRIAKPVSEVFELVRNLNEWKKWGPWLYLYPQSTVEVQGTGREVGEGYHWKGEEVGEGKMTHQVIDENEFLQMELEFIKPFPAKAKVSFHFHEEEGETSVAWVMDSALPFFMFWMKKSMVAMLEMDFERGLRMLKHVAEEGTAVPSKMNDMGVVELPEMYYVGFHMVSTMDQLPEVMKPAFGGAWKAMEEQGVKQCDMKAYTIYHKVDCTSDRYDFTAAFPVTQEDYEKFHVEGEHIEKGIVESGKYFGIEHVGNYMFLGNPWTKAAMDMRAQKIKELKGAPSMEVYENSPMDTKHEDLITKVYVPVK